MGGDYLDAAKQALGDSIDQQDDRLVRLASAHALIAVAEGLRALVGVMASIPIEDPADPAEHELVVEGAGD